MTAALAGATARRPGAACIDGHLDSGLSRWMWLVKWLLAAPHVLILALLWVAMPFVTAIAGVAILFTGRYPRPLFDFVVGVLRWSWRVVFYAFSVLGTDRYPPFTFGEAPDYPATLAVAYPEQLSRGLVLVKWWLLAIPQYVVVAILAGGWGAGSNTDGSAGLISVLVLIAAVVLLFTGSYPQGLFDFVLGLSRWCFRVLVYALLLRDEYPPFRLDTGGTDPGGPVPTGSVAVG